MNVLQIANRIAEVTRAIRGCISSGMQIPVDPMEFANIMDSAHARIDYNTPHRHQSMNIPQVTHSLRALELCTKKSPLHIACVN